MKARWHFDFVSPFSYLHLKLFGRIAAPLEIEYVPVLFAGLLKAAGSKGPAEIPAKRVQTYRYCTWLAREEAIPFRFPPRHPFNPLFALRLAIAAGATRETVERIFDAIWQEGRDPEDAATMKLMAERVGIVDYASAASAPEVKARLLENTSAASAAGIYGVPTFEIGGELFWGCDSLGMMNAFLRDPGYFREAEMARVSGLPVGTARKA
jgi:2-hydroxychromene-2-carboxylate isomerase